MRIHACMHAPVMSLTWKDIPLGGHLLLALMLSTMRWMMWPLASLGMVVGISIDRLRPLPCHRSGSLSVPGNEIDSIPCRCTLAVGRHVTLESQGCNRILAFIEPRNRGSMVVIRTAFLLEANQKQMLFATFGNI